MVKFIIIVFLILPTSLIAQVSIEQIRNAAQNNIIAYHISTLVDKEFEVSDNKFLKSEYFGEQISLFMRGQKMSLKMAVNHSLNHIFPDSNFVLYEVNIEPFDFWDTISHQGLSFSTPQYFFRYNENYLLAASKHDQRILFISGCCFCNNISTYYPRILSEAEIKKFVGLKLYNHDIKEFTRVINKNKEWHIECLIKDNATVFVVVPKENPDKLKIIYK